VPHRTRRHHPNRTAILYLVAHTFGSGLCRSGARPLAIENTLLWVLDVTFREDLSRLRIGHGAKNMAVVRHFALNLVRQVADNRSIKRRRKRAAWDPQYLLETLGPPRQRKC
jgi:predicted transposase YbfD/YdcC